MSKPSSLNGKSFPGAVRGLQSTYIDLAHGQNKIMTITAAQRRRDEES